MNKSVDELEFRRLLSSMQWYTEPYIDIKGASKQFEQGYHHCFDHFGRIFLMLNHLYYGYRIEAERAKVEFEDDVFTYFIDNMPVIIVKKSYGIGSFTYNARYFNIKTGEEFSSYEIEKVEKELKRKADYYKGIRYAR